VNPWDYLQAYPGRLKNQFYRGMGNFARYRNPASVVGSLNPTSPFIQDAALQAGGLIAPHANEMAQSISRSSENLGLGPLSIPEVTDKQLAPFLMLGMGGPSKMGFYSPSGKALTTAPGKGQSGQYLAHLKKEPGATKEAKETGLLQALEQAPGTLTKEEVVSMWNPIELDETVKGSVQSEDVANLESMFAIPEVMRAARNAVNADDLELTIANDGDAYRALERQFPNLTDQENWAEIVVRDIWKKQDQPANITKYGNEESLNLPGGSNPKEILVQLSLSQPNVAGEIRKVGIEEARELFGNKVPIHFWNESTGTAVAVSDPVSLTGHNKLIQSPDWVLRTGGVDVDGSVDPNYGNRSIWNFQDYKGTHWDEPNVLAHIRTNERDVGGRKALHIEEIQSDWHQQGQKKGYQNNAAVAEFEAYSKELAEKYDLNPQHNLAMYATSKNMSPDEVVKYNQLQNEVFDDEGDTGVPDAPFKKDWHELAFKRALMEGINDPSIERLTWTTGAVQADRYNLAKYINGIEAQRLQSGSIRQLEPNKMWQYQSPGGTYQTFRTKEEAEDAMKSSVELTGGNRYSIVVNQKEGGLEHLRDIRESELADYVGKEMAEKIVNDADGTTKTYSGLDLEVGGEFHKNLYDKKITKFAKKFLKKYGVEPEKWQAPSASENPTATAKDGTFYYVGGRADGDDIWHILKEMPDDSEGKWVDDVLMETPGNMDAAREALRKYGDLDDSPYDLWYIDFTPEMRQDLQQKGVPLTMNNRKPFLAYA